MPKRKLSLVRGEAKSLEINWNFGFKAMVITLDGETVGQIPDQAALNAGKTFTLDNGSTIKVQLQRNFLQPELLVWHNGEPVPGSDGDPVQRLNTGSMVLFVVAGLNLLLGAFVVALSLDAFAALGIGIGSIIGGLIYLGLGMAVRARSQPALSKVALILAVVLLVADGVMNTVMLVSNGRSPATGLPLRVILIMLLLRTFKAYDALEQA